MAQYANIIIDISYEKLDKTFQYKVPERMVGQIHPGMLVEIPFGKGETLRKGYVVEVTEEPVFDPAKTKEIFAVVETSVPIEAQLIELAAWIRQNYGATMNHALKTVLPIKKKAALKEKRILHLSATPEVAALELEAFRRKHAVAKERLLAELIDKERIPYEVATGKLHVTAATVRSLEENGLLKTEEVRADYRNPLANVKGKAYNITLNEAQQEVCDTVISDLQDGIHRTYLLHGVTGSGKTEVYMEIISAVLERGQQVIVLIPEIALTYQTVMRFYGRFGDVISILNSKMSPGERYDQYERAKNGEISIMIGPRSALFTPFSNLGLIIIDEEHETTYKSETLPRYHARETAIKRAEMCHASVVLGSATPSVESYYKALHGTYRLLELTDRVDERPLPTCEIVDLREELQNGNRSMLSLSLQEKMEACLERNEQMMLFLNRRGMSGFVSCRACGEVMKCPHCDVSLSLHRNGKLVCHYCGYEKPAVKLCPKCGSKYIGTFKAGTEKVEEIVQKRFPNARILRMDMDTTKEKNGHEKILNAFANQEADILIGTQMIVKGHDFPNVTLMGVLAADMSLHVSDFHSGERTFQLLTQAAGRAGRGTKKGEVVIQTYSPEHYSVVSAAQHDYQEFYKEEISFRELMDYPPFSSMLMILASSNRYEVAEEGAAKLKQCAEEWQLQEEERLWIIGPADAGVAKVKDQYRKVLYIKAEQKDLLLRVRDYIEKTMETKMDCRNLLLRFDFDPMNGF